MFYMLPTIVSKIWIMLFLMLIVHSAFANQLKTVCSITINSNDEINAMKSALSPKEFQFIELTELRDTDLKTNVNGIKSESERRSDSWLRNSCQSGIRCDVLVISGHFGGDFFGKSDIILALSSIEEASCDSKCTGIFHFPKEVFLFGCNTLAGKKRDHRTPEEYLNVLMSDGFSRSQAEQVVAYRYSSLGQSFHDRMSRSFAKVPRIYGFSSVAPVGNVSAPFFLQYLKKKGPVYSKYLNAIDEKQNFDLLNVFRSTSMTQTKGVDDRRRTPICYINDPQGKTLEKLKYIQQIFQTGGVLEMAPYFVNFFKNLFDKQLTQDEYEVLDQIRNDRQSAKSLEDIIRTPWPGLLKPQIDILNLMRTLDWISPAEYSKASAYLILNRIYTASSIDFSIKDQICSLQVQVKTVDVKKIPEKFWHNNDFLNTLGCLKPSNIEVANELKRRYSLKNSNKELIIDVLGQSGISNPSITTLFTNELNSSGYFANTVAIAKYFQKIDLNEDEVIKSLQKSLSMAKDEYSKQALNNAIFSIGRNRPEVILPILESAFLAKSFDTAGFYYYRLKTGHSDNKYIQKQILAAFDHPSNDLIFENAIKGMEVLELKSPEVLTRLKGVVDSSKYSFRSRQIAFNTIGSFYSHTDYNQSEHQEFGLWAIGLLKKENLQEMRLIISENPSVMHGLLQNFYWFCELILQETSLSVLENYSRLFYVGIDFYHQKNSISLIGKERQFFIDKLEKIYGYMKSFNSPIMSQYVSLIDEKIVLLKKME